MLPQRRWTMSGLQSWLRRYGVTALLLAMVAGELALMIRRDRAGAW